MAAALSCVLSQTCNADLPCPDMPESLSVSATEEHADEPSSMQEEEALATD